MKLRLPLYGKILLWFFLNLTAVALVSWLLLRDQFRFSALPARVAGDHVEKAAEAILADLVAKPVPEWNQRLGEYSRTYRVEFRILAASGRPVAGPRDPLPPEVHGRLFGPPRNDRPGGPPGPGRRPPRGDPLDEIFGEPPPPRGGRDAERPVLASVPSRVVMQSANPERYWVIVRVAPDHPEFRNGGVVLASSDSPTGHGFFFDVTPYVWWGAGVLGLSILIWFPFVRGVTQSIARMRRATGNIAAGRFDVRVDERRRDELGELGHEINRMAVRLAGYVNGQKRFLGDVAHELCAPTARLQMALAILEQRAASDADRERLADLREEAELMSGLVNELLQFAKASVAMKGADLRAVNLRELAEKAVRREAADTSAVEVEIPPALAVKADPDLLLRALSNLLRNAIRYAGHAGPITIAGGGDHKDAWLAVRDRGPGIPANELPHVFEPFYRVETARTPGQGGAGLGLAIVQTCVLACGGSVTAKNLDEGLEVKITLPVALADAVPAGAAT